MSDFGIHNLTKTKPTFVLKNLSPITDVHFVSFISTVVKIDSEYNKTFAHWLITVISLFYISCKPSDIFASLGEMC